MRTDNAASRRKGPSSPTHFDNRHKGKMNADQIPTLPALRTLGNLADVRPTIITDTREQTPLLFTNLVTVLGTLTSGDYAPRGLEHIAAIERKSAADLVSSVTHDRDRRLLGGRLTITKRAIDYGG